MAAAPTAATAPASSSSSFRVEVKRWHAVGVWTWGAGDDDDLCGICRAPYDGCPPDVRYPGDDAPVVWGTCGHAFHLQCIQRWLGAQAEPRCPMCRRPWEFKVAGEDGAGAEQQQQQQGGGGGAGGDENATTPSPQQPQQQQQPAPRRDSTPR